jgi:hypothetical protein
MSTEMDGIDKVYENRDDIRVIFTQIGTGVKNTGLVCSRWRPDERGFRAGTAGVPADLNSPDSESET